MKVPEPRKLKSGSWFIQLRLDGTSVPITKATKAECIQEARLIKAEFLAGRRRIEDGSVTLGRLVDDYIEKYTPARKFDSKKEKKGATRSEKPGFFAPR